MLCAFKFYSILRKDCVALVFTVARPSALHIKHLSNRFYCIVRLGVELGTKIVILRFDLIDKMLKLGTYLNTVLDEAN